MKRSLDLHVVCEGLEERASIVEDGERYRVTLGDRCYLVDAARAGDAWSLIIEGRQREVTVVPATQRGASGAANGGNAYWVSTDGSSRRVELLDPLAFLAAAKGSASGRARGGTVAADMPGRVASCLVEEGAEVAEGQGVLVVEAMKMENEIRAEAAGTVTRIYVEPGSAVESGDPLFDLTPSAP